MPWLEVWVEESENIAKRLIDFLPKKDIKLDEEEIIVKKQCLENNKIFEKTTPVVKRNRSNSI